MVMRIVLWYNNMVAGISPDGRLTCNLVSEV